MAIEIPAYKYAIIIAAFNEENSIASCVENTLSVFGEDAEIIVVNGGTDKTESIVTALQKKHPQVRHILNENDRGKGHAIRVGIENCNAPLSGQLDADLQFFPEDLKRLFETLEKTGADVALGSRFRPGVKHMPGSFPGLRSAGNLVVSGFASILFRHLMTDILAGIKVWKTDSVKKLGLKMDTFSYEVEIPARAVSMGMKVIDVAVSTAPRQSGESKVSVIGDGARIIVDTLRILFNN